MKTFKWGIIAAGSAFVISFLLGVISGVGASQIFLRAIIFAVVFFGIGFGIRFSIDSYFPDLLVSGSGANDGYGQSESEVTGSKVSIVMDNTGEYAVPELFRTPDDPSEMGHIDDLLSGTVGAGSSNRYAHGKGLDGGNGEGYNSGGGGGGFSSQLPSDDIPYLESDTTESSEETAPEGRAAFTPSFGDEGGLGGLPDLDMMARAFSSFGAESAAPRAVSSGAARGNVQDAAFMPSVEMEEAAETSAPRPNKGNKPEPMQGDFSPKELAEGIRSVLSKDK